MVRGLFEVSRREKIEMCLLLILLDMTNINGKGGELFDDVVPGDGSDSRAFLKPEIVRVS